MTNTGRSIQLQVSTVIACLVQ